MQTRGNSDSPIVIIGFGPTGLAYCIAACQSDVKKRKIIVFTDRVGLREYTRDAIFRFDAAFWTYIEKLIGPRAFQEAVSTGMIGPLTEGGPIFFVGPHRTIKIKNLEKLFFQCNLKFPQLEIIYLPKHSEDKILKIDKNQQTITFTQGIQTKEIPFSHIIEADGIWHTTLNLMPEHPIQYIGKQHPQLNNIHARINFKIIRFSDEDFRNFLIKGPDQKPSIQHFQSLGWKHQSIPEARIFVSDGTLYIGAECPQNLRNEDKRGIEIWLRTILSLYLTQYAINHLQAADHAIFQVNLNEANHSTMTLNPQTGSTLFLAGETLRKSHYQTGSGAQTGLQEAKLLVN